MRRFHNRDKAVLFTARMGCFLPLLILFNLFFGWLFLKPAVWLLTECVLILFLIINTYILIKKIPSFSSRDTDAIYIEAEPVEDKEKLK